MRPNLADYILSPTIWGIFLMTLLATWCLTPWVIRLAQRVGAVEGVGYRNIHTGRKPLLGGLAIALPFLLIVAWSLTNSTGMFRVLEGHRWDLIVLACGTVAIVAVGLIDDTLQLRARYKLLLQTGVALFVVSSGIVIQRVSIPWLGVLDLESIAPGLGMLVTLLWIVGIMNAVNLMDGLDGLATGICLIACLALAIIAGIGGATFVVLLNIALAGSLLGFLRYNWHPARIFLGDTGSLFLGFVLATVSLMGSYKSAGGMLILASMMALGLPIFETFMSMFRRYAGGLPIFAADSRHTHHRLLRKGLTQRQAAMVLYLVALVFMGASISAAFFSADSSAALVPIAVFLSGVLGITVFAGYTQSLSRKFSHRRQDTLRRVMFSRYAALGLRVKHTRREIECLLFMTCFELNLDFIEVRVGKYVRAAALDPVHTASFGAEICSDNGSIQTLLIKTSNGEPAQLRYRHSEHADEIERHTVATCLAQIFDAARTHNFDGDIFRAYASPYIAEIESHGPRELPAEPSPSIVVNSAKQPAHGTEGRASA